MSAGKEQHLLDARPVWRGLRRRYRCSDCAWYRLAGSWHRGRRAWRRHLFYVHGLPAPSPACDENEETPNDA